MTRALPSTLVALALCAGLYGLAACGAESAAPDPPPEFSEDAEAVRFVRSLREALQQGQRPPLEEVARLKEIGERYPEDHLVEETLLSILPALKDWSGLVAYLGRRASLNDQHRLLLTRVYIRQADYEGALRTIRELAERDAQHVEANALTARALYFLGRNEDAVVYFDRIQEAVVERGMSPEIALRAMIELDAGRLGEARAMLEAALPRDPDSAHLHNALARVLAALGEHEEAERHAQRVSQIQAEIERFELVAMRRAAQTMTLNAAWGRRDFEECQRLIYLYLPEVSPDFQDQLYGFLGSMYEAAGRGPEAAAAIERARQHARSGGD